VSDGGTMSDQPNVILICVDQWRGDALGCAGHAVVETPYLDHLASGGARCRRAYAAVPSCIAARAGLYTGLTQRTHGRVGYRDGIDWNYQHTMAGEFAKGGYQTQAVGKMHVHPARSLMGFHHVELHDGYLHFGRQRTCDSERLDDYLPWLRQRAGHDQDYFDHGVNCNAYTPRPWDKEEFLHPTNWVVHRSIDFLRRRDPGKPFFLYMSFHRPHPPLDPPAWAYEQYLDSDIPAPRIGDWADEFTAGRYDNANPCQTPKRWPADRIRRYLAAYYGHLTHIDHQIHRFTEALHEYGLSKNTYLCFVSDHGDMLGDHYLYAKSLGYEGSANVPLILRGPGQSGIRRGAVIDHVVELRDIMPTLLDCAGLPIPQAIEGQSFLPLARGEQAEWRGYLHGEHTALGQSAQWITDDRWKYTWYSGDGREQLFDLQNDPTELHECSREQPDALARLRACLIEALDGREEGFVQNQQLVTGRPVSPVLSHIVPR
jgi:arylsulfatase